MKRGVVNLTEKYRRKCLCCRATFGVYEELGDYWDLCEDCRADVVKKTHTKRGMVRSSYSKLMREIKKGATIENDK